jgi:hypothetical protein
MTERDPIWIDVVAGMGAGNLSIGPIRCEGGLEYADGAMLTGPTTRGHVRIDPSRNIVDTAIHELLHRMRPRWSERKVRAQTARMLKALSDAEVDRLYALILSVAKVKRRPIVVEAD